MILALQRLFSYDQAIPSDAASTNIIDLGAPGTPPLSSTALPRDIGPGTPIDILIQCTVAHGGTSPTLDIDLEVDDNDSFASAKIEFSYILIMVPQNGADLANHTRFIIAFYDEHDTFRLYFHMVLIYLNQPDMLTGEERPFHRKLPVRSLNYTLYNILIVPAAVFIAFRDFYAPLLRNVMCVNVVDRVGGRMGNETHQHAESDRSNFIQVALARDLHLVYFSAGQL